MRINFQDLNILSSQNLLSYLNKLRKLLEMNKATIRD